MTHDQLEKLADKYGSFFDDDGVDTWNFDLWELHALLIAAMDQEKEKHRVKN